MPSKIQLDENLWFLYLCLQNSDMKQIDFNAVGTASNLKPPAARMRFSRLKKRIEQGILTSVNGSPFIGAAKESKEKNDETSTAPATPSKKRKSTAGEGTGKTNYKVGEEEEKLEELGPVMKMRTRGIGKMVKLEDEEGEKGYLSSGGSSEYGDGAGDRDLDTDEDFEDKTTISKRVKMANMNRKRMEGSPTMERVQRRVALSSGGCPNFQPTALSTFEHHEGKFKKEAARSMRPSGHDSLQSADQLPVTFLQTFSISSPNRNEASQHLVLPKLESDLGL